MAVTSDDDSPSILCYCHQQEKLAVSEIGEGIPSTSSTLTLAEEEKLAEREEDEDKTVFYRHLVKRKTGATADDWRSQCNDMVSMRKKARIDTRFTDIQFVVGEEERKEFHAHSQILAVGSPVFEAMFYGPLAEKRRIIETDDDPEAFEMLLNCIYGTEMDLESLSCVLKYLAICDKYLVPKVLVCGEKYIESVKIDENNFWEAIKSDIFSIPIFQNALQSYLIPNASRLLNSKKFLSVPEHIVSYILQLDELNIKEYDLLVVVTLWAEQNMEEFNSNNLIKFYQYIRFSTLSNTEFYIFLDRFSAAIDAESSLKILQHLYRPFFHNLPNWCSTNKEARNRNLFLYIQFSSDSDHEDSVSDLEPDYSDY